MDNKIEFVLKRDGFQVDFNQDKITEAILKAGSATGEFTSDVAVVLSDETVKRIVSRRLEDALEVETVQDIVEEVLLDSNYNKTAKEYILYRARRADQRKRDIFKRRITLKPYEYPELAEYVDAIRHSYWIHTEFNYVSDIQDFKINVSPNERTAIKNTMLAIAQIEVTVKTFWGDIYKKMPKPEIGSVGYTFAESEVRHHDAYSHLLELLNLNHEFEKIYEIPQLIKRVKFLEKSVVSAQSGEDKDYALAILLFSIFIEHVSLFSQFLIIMSFNKYKNLFKGISNVIEATSKEEQIHGLFGIDLINIIKDEHPEWFDEEMKETVVAACLEAYETERELLDWIFEDGELDFLSKDVIKEFIKNRLNNSLESIGYNKIFEINQELVQLTDWFDDEIVATKHGDFFVKRSINYNKRSKSITSDDLF